MLFVDYRVSCFYNICLVNNYKFIEYWIYLSVYIFVYLFGKDDIFRFVYILIIVIFVNIRLFNF